MSSRKPKPWELTVLMMWHGALSGGFIVAFATMEGPYGVHAFAGYTVIVSILVRLFIASMAPVESPLFIPRPSLTAFITYFSALKDGTHQRNPLTAWISAAMLASIALGALSGLMVEASRSMDDFHEGAAMIAPGIIGLHMALVILGHWMKSLNKVATKVGVKAAQKPHPASAQKPAHELNRKPTPY